MEDGKWQGESGRVAEWHRGGGAGEVEKVERSGLGRHFFSFGMGGEMVDGNWELGGWSCALKGMTKEPPAAKLPGG